jgi:hypothetical protein
MKLFRFGSRRPAKIVAIRTRPGLEQLEGRDLPSTLGIVQPIKPIQPVNPVWAIANAEHAQDGTLTRTDVIELFNTVAGMDQAVFTAGKVSFKPIPKPDLSTPLLASSVATLQDIVTNSAQWGMTPDVADLASNVVDYSPANHTYKGHTLLTTGQLAAGDHAGILSDLVQKWFYGADLPKLDVAGATYKAAAGTLFGANGPQGSDVAQGAGDDCYFLSNLGEAAQQAPQVIQNMFIDNGDGTDTVRFFEYDNSTKSITPHYVTVNRELPVNAKGEFVYANAWFGGRQTNIDNSQNILWVALAEKAYAQLAEQGWSRANWSPQDDVNAYASIAFGNNRIAGQQITGNISAVWVSLAAGTSSQVTATMNTLAANFQKGDLITICTEDRNMTDPHLNKDHVYFVTAIDTQDDTITLTNPFWKGAGRTVTLSGPFHK